MWTCSNEVALGYGATPLKAYMRWIEARPYAHWLQRVMALKAPTYSRRFAHE